MRPYSPRRRARDRSYPQARIAVQERSQGLCEAGTSVCTGRLEQVHHKAGRTGPDPHADVTIWQGDSREAWKHLPEQSSMRS
jgi:hypothetical protein